jgi:hypothetical protein
MGAIENPPPKWLSFNYVIEVIKLPSLSRYGYEYGNNDTEYSVQSTSEETIILPWRSEILLLEEYVRKS